MDALPVQIVDDTRVQEMSLRLRALLQEHVPELVAAAESFAATVLYLPSSALGRMPEWDEQGRGSIRPADIQPLWACVPIVSGLQMATRGLFAVRADRGRGGQRDKGAVGS